MSFAVEAGATGNAITPSLTLPRVRRREARAAHGWGLLFGEAGA